MTISACGKAGPSYSSRRTAVTSNELQFALIQQGDLTAVIKTNFGDIHVVLYPKYSPLAVQNFILLAQQGSFQNSSFSRVIKDFIVQGGNADIPSAYGSPFPLEITSKLRHYSGALCTAASHESPPENGSQFYIVATPEDNLDEDALQLLRQAGYSEDAIQAYGDAGGAPYLDNTDTVFGQVYAGMDVVDRIASVKTNDENAPKNDVLILDVSVSTDAVSSTAAASSSAS